MRQKVKKIILILTLICIFPFSYESAYVYGGTSPNVLGTASDFSIFVINDHVHKSSDSTGRVAVGNNATYENYSIGNSLDMSSTRSDLIVGNTLNAIGGNNFNGNTSIGSKGKVINYSMTNNNNISSQPKKEDIIDFDQERKYLCTKTKELSLLASNGTVSNSYGQLNLNSSDKNLVVFNISNENLKGINGINIDVPESATVIINIIGKDVQIGNLSIFYKMNTPSQDIFRKWLWNFPQTESLSFYSISVKGSILAPNATFDAKGNGNIDGTVVLNNFYNNNAGFEVHNHPFNGSVPSNDKNGTITAPNNNPSGQGKTGEETLSDNVNKPKEPLTETTSNTVAKSEEKSPKSEDNSDKKKDTVKETNAEVNDVKDSTETEKSTSKEPKTGDTKNPIGIFSLLATSGMALIFLRKFK